ncbi:uncharacterized protein M421DRAFT_407167, partial [Didymella exigua CBS 183.55]
CDFGTDQHNLKRAFTELGIETASSVDGGPNQCFYVEHMYGAKVLMSTRSTPPLREQGYWVDDRRYRMTGAHFSIGINSASDIMYFLNVRSAQHAA